MITPPSQGMNLKEVLSQLLDNDDDFFHVTCHVDKTMKEKIEKGEYVDLERLIPHSRNQQRKFSDENRIELFQKGGETFVVPSTPTVERDGWVSSLKRWDQAFRVYAAIYTKAQPHRAAEVWQYVYCIHNAASTYVWDNVAEYDFIFRQLMAQKPLRNWSKTYFQGWQLAMKEHLPKQFNPGFGHGGGGNTNNGNGHRDNWRDRCCWKFNKNRRCGQNCNFDHRCSFCGSWMHSRLNCPKRKDKGGNKHSHRNDAYMDKEKRQTPPKWNNTHKK